MLNDEQILLKTAQLLENLSVSNKKPQELYEKVLREIEEGEFEAIQDVLDDLKGEDLAFNGLFNGEMRKIIDFPTMDPSTDLGKFGSFFKNQDFDVDWEKGLVSAERSLGPSTEDLLNQLMGGPPARPKKKKIQMKVGKYFAKVIELSSKGDILYQKVYDHMDKMNYIGAHGKIDVPWKVSGKMVKAALDEKEYEDYNRINTQIDLYIPNPGVAGPAGYNLTDLATKMAKYWKTNAGYIKKEINKLDNDKYSIIITRHPIDVMRMSDFDDITSCHSPPSSKGYQGVHYYKCAVAEARGHGAVAYVIETDDILHTTGTSNIESAEQEIQDGEIFYDDKRSYAGGGGELNPVSRVRLRQFRYYDTDTPKRWDDGTEMAVPEKSIYGANIPGLVDRVVKWAKENQQEVLEKMPTDNEGTFDLSKFMIFGGSYEDHPGFLGREELIVQLTGFPESLFDGAVRQNKETEDVIDLSLLGDNAARFERECNEIKDEWNNKYADVVVDFELEEQDTNEFGIVGNAWLQIDWPVDEWAKLPNPYPTGMHAAEHLNEQWGDIFISNDAFINRRNEGTIRWGCKLNGANPMVAKESSSHATSRGTYFSDPYEFRTFCEEIDVSIDDRRDGFRAGLEEFFKQEEWMDGGAYIKLAGEIENSEISSYEWDVRYDGEHPTESYEATAAVSYDFDPGSLELNPKVLFDILDSRDWRLAIRTALLASAQAAIGTKYFLDMEKHKTDQTGENVTYTLTFRITADDPDDRVKLFRELVTGEDSDMDDEDNLKAAFDGVMARVLNSRQPSHMQQNLDERLVKTWKGFIGR